MSNTLDQHCTSHLLSNQAIIQSERRPLSPYFESAYHNTFLLRTSSPDFIPVSSLNVNGKDKPLQCEGDENISIKYVIVGETAGIVDLMYLVSSDWSI